MTRRVERSEAARAVAGARRSSDDVVLVGAVAEGPFASAETRRLDQWRQQLGADGAIGEFWLYTLDDGSRYAWAMQQVEWMPTGTRLWCSDPRGADRVFCVRQSTVLPTVEVLRSAQGLLVMVSGPAAATAPVVDPAIVAPADPTSGTGVSDDDARQMLRRESELRRRTLQRLAAALVVSVVIIVVLPTSPLVWFVAAYALYELARLAWTHRGTSLPGREVAGDLQAVTITEIRDRGLEVSTSTGERYAWNTSDQVTGMHSGDRVWATPVAEGQRVHLVTTGDDGVTRISPSTTARLVRTPEPPS